MDDVAKIDSGETVLKIIFAKQFQLPQTFIVRQAK